MVSEQELRVASFSALEPQQKPPFPLTQARVVSQRSGIRRDKLFSALIAMGHQGSVSWDEEVGQRGGKGMWFRLELRSRSGTEQGHGGPSQRALGSEMGDLDLK